MTISVAACLLLPYLSLTVRRLPPSASGGKEGKEGVFAKTGEEQKVRVGCPNGRETENGNIHIERLQKNSSKQAHLHSD